ncbi:centromere protein W [Triplophysa rosa]|uniref:Centromere protein W n=1 Tax=Triplophysa rosa TaxID=992332 RepID=A0A9W7WQ82_TRIRA|nr:centromere protein W [Triplophysa rosa]KAI7806296.1 putative centromere protein W [Triplophysa rosa]
MSKRAPRATLKFHMKSNADIRIGKDADLMAQLNLLVVLHHLAEESRVKAFEEKSATVKVHHVTAAAKKLLKSVRG